MSAAYLGRLPREDPLHGYLCSQVAPWCGPVRPESFRVFRLGGSCNVYLYEEQGCAFRVVGKFFGRKQRPNPFAPAERARTEYNNLVFLREMGFGGPPHQVVRPLGCAPDIDNLLVVEHLRGTLLDEVIQGAIQHGARERLFGKLGALARFLAALHNRTAGDWRVNFDESRAYMTRLLGSLARKGVLDQGRAQVFHALGDAWRGRACMWEDNNVLVHGDATPANFLFGHGSHVMAIDLERMKWADRVFDLGRLCGEIKHFWLRGTGDPAAAEPFIGHFLWEYCGPFPDQGRAFAAITRRLPFYMGITLLRIARNSWLDWGHRQRLVHEAGVILGFGA